MLKKETELAGIKVKLLQDQITPHFVYNALAIIKSLTYENSEKAAQTIDDFSTYLRQNVNAQKHSGSTIPFTKELEPDKETVAGFYNGKSNLGQNIRNLRIKHGLSVPQLAEKLSVTVQTVYRRENGERTPDIVKFVMPADLLGVDIHELLI